MRYLSAFAISFPGFALFLAWGMSGGLPVATLGAVVIVAAVTGVLLGCAMARDVVANLLHGHTSILTRRFPGGFGFVVAVGLIGGFACALLWQLPIGPLLIRGAAVGFATLGVVTFAIVGVRVFRLERSYGRRVYMWPDGLYFEDTPE